MSMKMRNRKEKEKRKEKKEEEKTCPITIEFGIIILIETELGSRPSCARSYSKV